MVSIVVYYMYIMSMHELRLSACVYVARFVEEFRSRVSCRE